MDDEVFESSGSSEEESDESGESWDDLEEKARKGKYYSFVLRKYIVNKTLLL